MRDNLARDAKVTDLDAWTSFDVLEPFKERNVTKAGVKTRKVITRVMMHGKRSVEARLVDLKEGAVDTSGCVSFRSSHLQAIP